MWNKYNLGWISFSFLLHSFLICAKSSQPLKNILQKFFLLFCIFQSLLNLLKRLDWMWMSSGMVAHLDELTVLWNNALHKTKHHVTIKCETFPWLSPWCLRLKSSNSLWTKIKMWLSSENSLFGDLTQSSCHHGHCDFSSCSVAVCVSQWLRWGSWEGLRPQLEVVWG